LNINTWSNGGRPAFERSAPRRRALEFGPEPLEIEHGREPLEVVTLVRQPGQPLLDVQKTRPDAPF